MKIAFVAGFFDPVKRSLEKRYPKEQYRRSVFWVQQAKGGGFAREVNLSEFSSLFMDKTSQATSVLVVLALPTGREFVELAVQGIIDKVAAMRPEMDWKLETLRNVSDGEAVLKHLEDFGLPDPAAVDSGKIREKVKSGKILCVSLDGKTRVFDALARAGFTAEAIESCFEEERIEGGRNSNLNEALSSRGGKRSHLLYAWDGLRTLTPEVKKKFVKCYEASDAAKVVAIFKRWVEDGT